MQVAMYPFSAETMEFRHVIAQATTLQRRARKLRLAGNTREAGAIQAKITAMLATVDGGQR